MSKAKGKATSVDASAKKASKAAPTQAQMVTYCVAAFGDYLHADATLQNVKALFDAARLGLRTELARAYKVIGSGKSWDAFKADLRAAMVTAKISETPKDAGRLINNALIALGITGNGARHGGKKAGRKAKESGKGVDSTDKLGARMAALRVWFGLMQTKHADDPEVLEDFAEGMAIASGKTK
jgi:hypothetical protein